MNFTEEVIILKRSDYDITEEMMILKRNGYEFY